MGGTPVVQARVTFILLRIAGQAGVTEPALKARRILFCFKELAQHVVGLHTMQQTMHITN